MSADPISPGLRSPASCRLFAPSYKSLRRVFWNNLSDIRSSTRSQVPVTLPAFYSHAEFFISDKFPSETESAASQVFANARRAGYSAAVRVASRQFSGSFFVLVPLHLRRNISPLLLLLGYTRAPPRLRAGVTWAVLPHDILSYLIRRIMLLWETHCFLPSKCLFLDVVICRRENTMWSQLKWRRNRSRQILGSGTFRGLKSQHYNHT